MAATLVPPALAGQVDSTKASVIHSVDALIAQLNGFDPSLAKSLGRSRAKIVYQVENLGRKTARESLRRDERAGRDATELSGLLYPHKHLQERFYSILPLLAKHGPQLVETVYEAIQPSCPDHQLLVL